MGEATGQQVVMVRRELLEACLTCPICKKLFEDATTVSECLHTFCWRCIYEKLTEEELHRCPVCNIYLGCTPTEKLRPDNNLQDVRQNIFPQKKRKVGANEIAASNPLPVRRKERLLSSLVVSSPRVATQSTLTGRRTKPKSLAKKASTLETITTYSDFYNKEESPDRDQKSSGLNETLQKISKSRTQSSIDAVVPKHSPFKENQHTVIPDKAELWKPLNCLVDAANRSKSLKNNQHGFVAKIEETKSSETEIIIHEANDGDSLHKFEVQDDSKNNVNTTPVSAKAKRLPGVSRKRAAAARERRNLAQALVDAAGVRQQKAGCIWFSLIASTPGVDDVDGNDTLPQISASYLRIKDKSLPAAFIQKYLAKKLDLTSDADVEITCRGRPVAPSLSLHQLVELWLQTEKSEKAHASVGASAKDFVMILNYSRRVSDPLHHLPPDSSSPTIP